MSYMQKIKTSVLLKFVPLVAGVLIDHCVDGNFYWCQVFKIKRSGEEKRYKPFRKLHNRKLLWHGSRLTNFAGILSQV